jgi:hypothetical protein
VGIAEKDEMKKELLPRAPKAKALAERKEIISFTIAVKDVKTAYKETENALMQLEGKVIKKESYKDGAIITAELDASKVKELMEKLKSLGEVRETALETLEGIVEIRIEILKI